MRHGNLRVISNRFSLEVNIVRARVQLKNFTRKIKASKIGDFASHMTHTTRKNVFATEPVTWVVNPKKVQEQYLAGALAVVWVSMSC